MFELPHRIEQKPLEFPDELKNPVRVNSSLFTLAQHLGYLPDENYLKEEHPELAAAVAYHGGIEKLTRAFPQEAELNEQILNEIHEKSILLHQRALNGDGHAKDALFRMYRIPAGKLAARLLSHRLRGARSWVSTEAADLENEGLLALFERMREYDPSQSRFQTFAHGVMKSAMRHYLRDKTQIIREPAWFQEMKFKVANATEFFIHERNRKPSFEEIAKRAGVSVEHVIEVFTHNPPISIDALLSLSQGAGEAEDRSGFKFLGSPDSLREFERIEKAMLFHKALHDHVKFSEKERKALEMHAGEHSIEEIAAELGVSKAMASRFIYEAKKKIRGNLLLRHELGID